MNFVSHFIIRHFIAAQVANRDSLTWNTPVLPASGLDYISFKTRRIQLGFDKTCEAVSDVFEDTLHQCLEIK